MPKNDDVGRVGVDGDVPRPSSPALTRRLARAAYPRGRRHRVGRGSCPRPRACRGPCRAPVGGDPWRRPSDCDDRCCQRRASPSCRGHRDAYRPSDRRGACRGRGTCRGRGNRREPCRPRRPVVPRRPAWKRFSVSPQAAPLSHPRRVDISRTFRHCSPAQLYRRHHDHHLAPTLVDQAYRTRQGGSARRRCPRCQGGACR